MGSSCEVGAGGAYVLLIEDDRFNRMLYRELLEREGYRVYAVSSAQEGLAMAECCPPCLIVVDLELPDLNGLELTARLRASLALRETAILMISAHADPHYEAQAYAAGVADFHRKPIDFPSFQRAVRDLARCDPVGG